MKRPLYFYTRVYYIFPSENGARSIHVCIARFYFSFRFTTQRTESLPSTFPWSFIIAQSFGHWNKNRNNISGKSLLFLWNSSKCSGPWGEKINFYLIFCNSINAVFSFEIPAHTLRKFRNIFFSFYVSLCSLLGLSIPAIFFSKLVFRNIQHMFLQADNGIVINGNSNVNNNATIGLNGNIVINSKSKPLGLSSDVCTINANSKQSERNDHLRNENGNPIINGNRQKSSKENLHETIVADINGTDVGDNISGESYLFN